MTTEERTELDLEAAKTNRINEAKGLDNTLQNDVADATKLIGKVRSMSEAKLIKPQTLLRHVSNHISNT